MQQRLIIDASQGNWDILKGHRKMDPVNIAKSDGAKINKHNVLPFIPPPVQPAIPKAPVQNPPAPAAQPIVTKQSIQKPVSDYDYDVHDCITIEDVYNKFQNTIIIKLE